MKIYCDKCKKEGVIDKLKNPLPEPEYTMQDIVDGKNENTYWTTADIKWIDMVLECPYCGYCREYSCGSGGLRPITLKENLHDQT